MSSDTDRGNTPTPETDGDLISSWKSGAHKRKGPPVDWTKHSPLPWSACGNAKCSCGQIWTADHPIANVERGEWGDTWPSIRIVGHSSFELKAEAFLDKSVYGTIPNEVAQANAAFIVQAVNAHDDLVAALRGLLSFVQKQDCAIDTDFADAALAKAGAS